MNKITIAEQNNNKQHPSAGRFFSIFSASAVTLLILFVLNIFGILDFNNTNNAYAADSITLSISNSTLAINLFPDNTTGTFSKSSSANISISTTSTSGYTLSIVGSNDTRNLVGSDTASGNNLSSISSSTTEATFSSNDESDYTTYNNKWGYMPSEYVNYVNDEPVSISNTGANAVFLPGPTTAGDILKVTDCANGATGCSSGADTVSIAIGARANSDMVKGTYANTFVIQAVTNTSVVECDDTKLCVQYDGNGLTFPATESQSERLVNNVNYDSNTTQAQVTKYSHTPNISDDGTYSGSTYTSNMDTTDTVTIPGATSLNVTIYYDTEHASYDWVSVYQSPFDITNSNDATASNTTGNLSGKLAGRKSNRTTSYTTWYTQTYNVSGDTVKFHFRSDGGGNYYGYYAIITGTSIVRDRTLTSGEYATPTGTNAVFHGWSSTATTPGAGLSSDVEYADEAAVKSNIPGDNTETKTLYAVWQQGYPITFTMDGNASSIAVVDDSGTTVGTITSSGQSLNLLGGNTYTLKPTYATGYTTNIIDKTTGAGTVTSKFPNADFTVGTGSATISITSRQMLPMQSYSCSSLAVGDTDMVYDTRDNTSYLIGKLADNKCWMLDNLALDLLDSSVKSAMYNSSDTKTNASYATLGKLFNGGGTTSDQYATAAVANWTSSYSYSAPLVNLTNKDVIPTDATSTAGGYKVGGYYNYCAATAGSYCYGNGTSYGTSSGNATEDICPKGWRMPTGNTSGEFSALANAIYGSTSSTYDPTAYANYRAALRLPLSGNFNDGSPSNQGTGGSWWSSTRYGSNYMYYLSAYYTSIIYPGNSYFRYNGDSLRCIIGS